MERGAAGRQHRAAVEPREAQRPTLLAARTPQFQGNANLTPQQASMYEVGVRGHHGDANAKAVWFYTLIDDEILVDATGQNQNFDTRRVGIELAADWSWAKRVKLGANYAFVDAAFRNGTYDGRTIPATPAHLINASVAVSPIDSLWVRLDWRLVQDFYRVNDLNNKLGKGRNYSVLNLVCDYTLPKTWAARGWPQATAFLRVENLTNEEYGTFDSSNGSNLLGAGEYPMPPINLLAGVWTTF